ncbi:uncharacterized protein LOC105839000 [Monomorium pharaonis]|uniref:uncharacterized protein LOC105839000 n=1 Tax=Monomorium pharaonis TaxID=307658 RepID=UPI00063FB794|nr:uncharacterized protein LOC105839000 [Monomorium pharaonis]XP_012540433.1 uncharacterized protein LOC105839000 [Monomorium pharaonis]XP_012540434.1 uncharacterized protein LOC105839000 [Monomorium pharaonis]XP_012540435.1 uncharacterized protein LOC105839000 [Monomorium pharaonis]XP_028049681.1 uncharacterized protein LOC105839000 [Monomorium pharaonis]XP_036149896.1 uncharacterized protein LOC105839000 [Monomorium pharaonis]
MELDTVNAYSTVGMEQGLSGDPWDCLFGSDSISDAFQGRPEMLHMGIRRCDNTDQVGWLGFDFDDVLTETDEDPIGFNEKSHSSNSNLEELNLDSDSELALTLDPNLILPRNMPSRSPATNSDAAILETASVEENTAAENEGEETENESEIDRTENDEENESEEEDEEEDEEVENEENEHNETEYETEEEETEDEDEEEEEEEEEEGEETEDDEQDTTVQQPLTPLSVEAPTSISSSSEASVGARTLTAAAALATSSPTIQLTRLHHPNKINTLSAATVKDIKMLAANPGSQSAALQQIRKQMPYNNNVHDVSTGAPTTVMIQAAKREKDLTTTTTTTTTGSQRDNSYPKPAYSYSCLIAMALKNSRTGSLPVSEIYNFMCRHFPYFTTAPTGWKNSVRHNLSLNKCFEKIEKPPGNGSQRKGCLWAIAPSKVAKMDEEVRKWSRKDPTAIKRAMVNPDQLELLERGEMKYEGEDRQEDGYEDAESYADSETGGSAVDEVINDDVDENITYDAGKLIDVDDDLVVEQLYEDLDLVDSGDLLETQELNRGEQLMYQLVSCAKRQKTLSGSPISSDYVYQQVDAPSRKKAHFVALRPGGTAPSAGSLLEAE